ncbi:MAG: DMT family transporter [Acidobacteriia bacterium]|nr:DMT family transporter [Terriglobia bacterium]
MNAADAHSAPPAAKPSGTVLYAMIAFMVVAWALNFIVGKIALREIPALVLPGLRIALAAILFIPIFLWDRRRTRHHFAWRDLPTLILVSVCGITLNQFFFIAGLYRTSVAHMAVFISITPVLVLLIAAAIGQERITAPKLCGMLVASAGVLSIELSNQGDAGIATPLGDLYAFLGTLSFSIYTVAGKGISSRYGSIPMNTLAYAIGAVTLLPVAWSDRASFHISTLSAAAWWSLIYMVVFGSVFAYLIYYYALVHIPASRVAAFTYAEPVLAAILGFALLGEPVTWILALGGAMVLGGVWIAERA